MSQYLNAPQREAIHYLDTPCLVLAGAGSGKTRVITHKIAWLIEKCDIEPSRIAAITFTNKAATEMKERLGKLMANKAAGRVLLCTFHALGVRILREEALHCGLKPKFSILDAADTVQIIADIAANTDKSVARQLQWQISSWKNAMISPEKAAKNEVSDEISAAAAKLYAEYERTLRAYQAVDFDDLIGLPVKLFEENDDVRLRWQNRLRYLLVDEYQDTNRAQYQLLKQLVGVREALTVVGDDDQAIYAWRGADVHNITQLQQDYPRLKVIKLEQNYRSSARILHAANTLIENNQKLFPKKLWSDHGAGDPVAVVNCRDAEHEAESVVMKISAHKFQHRCRFSDYAVLYRGNHQARLLEQQLRHHNVPYVLSGGQSFFEKSEIRDVMAWLRLAVNEDDDPAFIRAITTPRRGIGSATLQLLGNYAGQRHISLYAACFEEGARHQIPVRQWHLLEEFAQFVERFQQRAATEAPAKLLSDMLAAIEYEVWLFQHLDVRDAESRWKNITDFLAWVGRKGDTEEKNLLELAHNIALSAMLNRDDNEFDGVQLATLHAAKGLEFPHVFMIGVEEGILPHQSSIDDDKVEEERRLMYVGVTRAQRSLTISWCEKRKAGKDVRVCEPSRFIEELGEGVAVRSRQNKTPLSQDEGRARLASLRAMLDRE